MIYDVFLYDGEAEMLAARLDHLRGQVAAHVAVIANRTHQGEPIAPPILVSGPDNLYDVRVDLSSHDCRGRGGVGTVDYSVRERTHRDAMKLANGEEGDVVLLSDLDEIPSGRALAHVLSHIEQDVFVCQQRMHEYALDWLHPQCWLGTMAVRLGPDGKWPMSPQDARDARGTPRVEEIEDGGWHLTWMGGVDACARKRERFSHAEHLHVDDLGFAEARRLGIDVNGVRMTRTDESWQSWPSGLLKRALENPGYWLLP